MKQLTFHSFLTFVLLFVLVAATHAQKKKVSKNTYKHSQQAKKLSPAGDTDEQVKNGIKINAKGFKVAEAYLFYDDETPVPEHNRVELNQNINLLLIIDSGWSVLEGKVFPGSKQIIRTSNGVEMHDSEELFAAFNDTGVPEEDARYITLNAVITELSDKKKHAVVNFRVWDKKGDSEITGSYKLFIK